MQAIRQIVETKKLKDLIDIPDDFSHVGRNKPVRAIARTGVSGKHHPNSPETPPRATRLDGLIPAYINFST
jgi:hypothetical protein